MTLLSRGTVIAAADSAEVAASTRDAGARPIERGYPDRRWDPLKVGASLARDPVWVYDNWAAYAEGVKGLQDTPLTQELAMRQLEQLIRYKRLGVHFDYYLMNAFWFCPNGAYREWRRPNWPSGPDCWISACQEAGIKPGMWFGTNSLWKINAAPEWRDSLSSEPHEGWPWDTLSMFEGGFIGHFMETLEHWYGRGIRLFEFDSVDFGAATAAARKRLSVEEIREKNSSTLREALKALRRKHPEVMLVAFNDFGGDYESTSSPFPFKNPVDLRWLEAFDTLYSGDVRASDVPQASFWRSVDLYNDHLVRRYEQSGVPLERIDPFFTLSSSWFGYHRGKAAWKGALLLTSARGSWKQTIYGSLDLLNDEEVRWFARVQDLYAPLLAMGRTKTFGGIPGEAQPYGYGSFAAEGALYTVVNPTQEVRTVGLPLMSAAQSSLSGGRILFRDAGFAASLKGAAMVLGPGQMAVAGFGRYDAQEYDLGLQEDVVIPRKIERLAAAFRAAGRNAVEATLNVPPRGDVRVLFQQRALDGSVHKNDRGEKWGRIEARQGGKAILVDTDLDGKQVGFGSISWSSGEISHKLLTPGKPLTVRYSLDTQKAVTLEGKAYSVEY